MNFVLSLVRASPDDVPSLAQLYIWWPLLHCLSPDITSLVSPGQGKRGVCLVNPEHAHVPQRALATTAQRSGIMLEMHP